METSQEKKLELSAHDRTIGGVCGGIGHFLNMDSSIIRIVFILATFFLYAFPVLVYIVLWIVLPRESLKKALSEETKDSEQEKKKNKTKNGMVLSILFATFLIAIGVSLILPDSKWILKNAGVIILSGAFLLLSVKMAIVLFQEKNASPIALSIVIVLATLSVFIPLVTYKVLSNGVILEYGKFLFPAILILAGILIILNSTHSETARKAALVMTIVVFAGLGVLSMVKGNYSIQDKFSNMMNWSKWTRFTTDQEQYKMVLSKGEYKKVVYTIVNRAGSFKLDSGKDLMMLKVNGMLPRFETNVVNGILYVTIENQAAEAKLEVSPDILTTINSEVSAGDMNMDLRDLNIDQLDQKIKLGHVKVKAGTSLQKILISLQAGDLDMEIPEEKDVVMTLQSSGSHLDLPQGFMFSDGKYMYQGKSDKQLTIEGSVSGGQFSLDLD